MLQTLREAPAIKKFVLWLVVGGMVLGIGIGVTAVLGDLLTGRTDQSRQSISGPWAMQVGSQVITPYAFESELRQVARELDRLGLSQLPDFTSQVRNEAARRIVRRAIETEEARKAGLRVSDREVSDRIHAIPDLQRDGLFVGLEEYRRRLEFNQIDVASFEAGVRDDMLIGKWRQLVGAGAVVSEREVDEELARRNDKVRYDFVLLDSSKFASEAPPSEAEIRSWHDRHKDRYQRGETRRAKVVLVDVKEDDKELTQPTDDDLQKTWESDRTRWPGTLEESRDAIRRQLLFQMAQAETDQRAAALRTAVTDAAQLDAAAAQAGLTVQDPGPLRRETAGSSPFGPALVEAVFAAAAGAVGGPVRTLKGSAVFVVTESLPPSPAPLEEARADVVADLQKDKAREAALAAAKRAVAGAGEDLEQVAKALGQTVQTGPLTAKGEPVPTIGYDEAVTAAAFATGVGRLAPPTATAGGSVVVLKVQEKQVPDPGSIAGQRDAVRDELRKARQTALVDALYESARKATEFRANEDYLRQFGT